MALDHCRWTTHRDRFDNVGIECSLDQVSNIADAARFFLKHVDKHFPDPLSLFLRIGNTFERAQKQMSSANSGDVQFHALAQQRERRFKLALAQQAIVDKDTSLPVSHSLVHEGRSDSRIDSTRQA